MCGRYRTKADSQEDFTQRWGAWGKAVAASMGQLEVRPTDGIAVVMERDGERRAEVVRWGFQPPGSARPLINARDDKLLTQPLWRRSVSEARGRVLIPADGWYEWLAAEDPKAKVKKQPFLHTVDGGAEFAFAGLLGYAIVRGEKVPAATIITTSSAGEASRIHDRMPVVLPDEDAEHAWLADDADPAELVADLCVPLTTRVTVEPVELAKQKPKPKPQLPLLDDNSALLTISTPLTNTFQPPEGQNVHLTPSTTATHRSRPSPERPPPTQTHPARSDRPGSATTDRRESGPPSEAQHRLQAATEQAGRGEAERATRTHGALASALRAAMHHV